MTAATTIDRSLAKVWRRTTGFIMLAMGAVGLLGLSFSVLRVTWFTATSSYCVDGTCTPSAVTDTDTILAGRDALAAAGISDGIVMVLGYVYFTVLVFGLVLVLLASAAWALAGHPREWGGFFAKSSAVTSLRIVTLAATGFVLLYLANLPSMLWFSHVTD